MAKHSVLLIVFLLAFSFSCAYYSPQETPSLSQIWDKNGVTLIKAIEKLYEEKMTYKDGHCHFFETPDKGDEIEYEIDKCHIKHTIQKKVSRIERQNGFEIKGYIWIEGSSFRTRPHSGDWSTWKPSNKIRIKSWQQKTGYDFRKRNGEFEFIPKLGILKIHRKSKIIPKGFSNADTKEQLAVILIGASPLILLIILGIYRRKTVGTRGEKYTARRIKSITKGIVFRDMYINGSHDVQQVDIIAVTEKGILVVEKKTYTGLIVGTSYDRMWRVYYYGQQKHMMKNPHHQNYGHIKALCETFPALKDKFINLVIFSNSATLGDRIPPGTIYDYEFKFVYNNLPTILNAEEIANIARDIEALNIDRPLLKRIHKGKIKRLTGGW